MTAEWKAKAQLFFSERGSAPLAGPPSLEDLCFVSGRDPRLWRDPTLYASLIDSIVVTTAATRSSEVLEVGCAAGFIAKGLAPRVGRYIGVDIAPSVVALAGLLELDNAAFVVADAEALPFPDGSFDAAICYDVLTNFPDVPAAEPLVREMARVVRPGGSLLLGSIPDSELSEPYAVRVAEVSRELEASWGPPQPQPSQSGSVSGYSFDRAAFADLGERLGLSVELRDIHAENPYAGYRFNAVYRKPAA